MGSGNLLLQGSPHSVAEAVQWITRAAFTKRVSVNLEGSESYQRYSAAPDTPFQTHGLQLLSLPAAPAEHYCGAPGSPASFALSSPNSFNLSTVPLPPTFSLGIPNSPRPMFHSGPV